MPLHDWSRIPAGLFHDFHQTWSIQIKPALNAGILPKGFSALVEQRSGPGESDVLAIERLARPRSEIGEEKEFAFPDGKDRILASYETGDMQAYYVEPIGIGDILSEMPLFLTTGWQVPVPLESTYQATWNTSPEDFRVAIETGVMPELDVE